MEKTITTEMMNHSLMIVGGLEESRDEPYEVVCAKNKQLNSSKPDIFRKMFSLKRIRVSTVYALLIATILLSLLAAIATCTELRNAPSELKHMSQLTKEYIDGSSVIRFSSFALLLLTCTLALVSIIRREKINAKLLSKLKSTNRQLNDEVQMRTSQLTEAIKAKDHFMGVAAHDLKAPLSGIEGLVELIKMENKNMSPTETEYLGHIKYSCKKMQRLIIDILDVNRIEQGKAMMIWQKVSIMSILEQIQFGFVPQAAKKNIDFQIEAIDAVMETDPDGLSRILENLVSNAVKFSPAMKKVSLSVRSENHQLKFKVSDEGPGIPQDEQPRLFNKFQRLSNRPTNSEISTGLGLSIVKELVTQLGGEITFTSEVGKGSTFIVSLPQFRRSGDTSKLGKQGRATHSEWEKETWHILKPFNRARAI
jgi:signal transduction histidine kinase